MKRMMISLLLLTGGAVAGAWGAAALGEPDADSRMIVEVRTYTLRPGVRDDFVRAFEEEAVPALKALGVRVIGSFVSVENENTFVWLRGFKNAKDREEKNRVFYSSEAWRGMAPRIAPLIVQGGIDVKVVTPTPGSAIHG